MPLTRADWLALLMASESDQPHEWPAIGWTARYRLLSRKWGTEMSSVVLAPAQFSYFNDLTKGLDLKDPASLPVVWEKAIEGYAGTLYPAAVPCAAAVLDAPLWAAPFGRDVLHYYSPVSMKPKGSTPKHFEKASRVFTPAGTDPARFVFGAGIP